jgi:hypothetical protein
VAGEDASGVEKLIGYIRDDLQRIDKKIDDRFDKMVSADAFRSERERVDAKFASLGSELVEEREARIAAVAELEQAAQKASAKAEAAHNERVRTRAAWKQGIVIGLILTLGGGVVTLLVALVQSAAHLN